MVAGLAFLYIFLEGIVAVIGTSLGVLAAEDFANFIPSILVFVSSFLVYGFGNRLVADRTRYAAGLSVRKVSGALVLFSFGLALSAWPPASWLQYTFTYPAVVLLAFSVSPLIAFSKSSSYRNAGMYLLKSSDRWTAIAGLIGFAVSLLSIPKPPSWDYYIFVFVLVMSGLVICYVGFRVYSLGSERIRRVNQEIYSKYQHKLETNFRQDFDFLYSAGENFLIDGEPGRLLVALTLLLSNSGREYDECARLLEPLIRYKAPPVYEYNVFGLRSALEEEADRRLGIFNMVMSDLSRVTTATPAAATLTR